MMSQNLFFQYIITGPKAPDTLKKIHLNIHFYYIENIFLNYLTKRKQYKYILYVYVTDNFKFNKTQMM